MKKQFLIFALLSSLLPLLLLLSSCSSSGSMITTRSGLIYEIVAEGEGPAAVPGQLVRIHETTTLINGTLIYSTRTNNRPITFFLGGNQVIAGVDEAVTGMRTGERRKAIVPPSLSKRSSYPANTPPDSTLYYDIELVEIVGQ